MPVRRTKQNLIVIVIAIAIILSSIFATVYVSEKLASGNAEEQGYQNVTFTDAVLSCENRTRSEFSSSLSQLVVDRHSSRYDNEVFRYKVFLVAYTKKEKAETAEHFITCYVKSSNGRISKFETFENVDSGDGEAIKKGGDKFIEWPQ